MIFPNIKVQPHWLETLEAAVEVLPKHHLVCVAVDLGIRPETEKEICEAIAQAIAPSHTVVSWLIHETGEDKLAIRKKAKEYRSAWLNHMIKQCRSMQPKGEV